MNDFGNPVAWSRIRHAAVSSRCSRRGATAVMALVVLMVLSGLMGIVMHSVIAERRQMQRQSWQDQTEQLVTSAFSIAERMLKTTPGWAGTTWTLPSGVLHQTNSAEVVIRVLDGHCTVIATYPAQMEQTVRITRTRTISSKAE
jgi:hypothetical protein